MKPERDLVPILVTDRLDGRPTRWVPIDRLVGDFDGRDRTLEVFDVRARDQRLLLRRLRSLRGEIEAQIGGPLLVVFHTPGETERLYPEIHDLRRGYQLLGEPIPSLGEAAPVEYTPDSTIVDPPYEEAA